MTLGHPAGKDLADKPVLEYDYQGTRTRKMVNGTEHIYVMQNGNLLSEEIANLTEHYTNYYFYNQSGLFGAVIKGVVYYYVKDFRGDILEIRKASDNSLAASYEYDAWGNHVVYDANGNENTDPNFIGNLNPFRYRGYYYDTDVKLYYLQTRWYDPEVGRFINLDQISYLDPETVNGLNLYAYCGNNPVMGYDPEGTIDWSKVWGWVTTAAIAVVAVAAITVAAVGVVATGGLAGSILIGAGSGALISMGVSISEQGGFSNADPWEVAKEGGIGTVIGGFSGATSWVGGVLTSNISQGIGFTLSHGVLGKVFTPQIITAASQITGRVLSGLAGATFGNYLASEAFGKDLSEEEIFNEGIYNEAPSWIISFLRWLCV